MTTRSSLGADSLHTHVVGLQYWVACISSASTGITTGTEANSGIKINSITMNCSGTGKAAAVR